MRFSLQHVSIVILAVRFNPSISTKDWLLKNQIFEEQPTDFINTPDISGYDSPNYRLTILPDKFQLVLKIINDSNLESCSSIVKKYVSLLPETAYNAVGHNFGWIARPELNESSTEILHDLFDSDRGRVASILENKEFLIGSIIYSIKEEYRLRINIEPDLKANDILVNFNFHIDVKDLSKTQSAVDLFASCRKESQRVIEIIFQRKN